MFRTSAEACGRVLHSCIRWRPGRLAWTSAELTAWLFIRAAAQGAAVILLARILGADDYGTFVATLAMASISASLAGLGMPSVLLRDGSRNPAELPTLLFSALKVWWRIVLALTAATSVIVIIVLPPVGAPAVAIHAMILAEVLTVSMVELMGRAFQARKAIRVYGAMQAGLPAVRLVALGSMWSTGLHDLTSWLAVYVVASLGYAAAIAWYTHTRIAWRPGTRRPGTMAREGVPFATGSVSTRLQAEYNKPLLAQISYASAGYFNVAQRLVDLISLPIMAFQEALWPRLYGDADHRRRLLIAGAALCCMSLGAAAVVIALAPMIPVIFGEAFRSAAALMPWLALLPLLAVLRGLGNFQLIATQRTHLLTRIYVISGAAGILFSSLLIPRYGLAGAVCATYATDAVALLTTLVTLRMRRWNNVTD